MLKLQKLSNNSVGFFLYFYVFSVYLTLKLIYINIEERQWFY